MALCDLQFFGPATDLQDQLDLAYDSFRSFCRAEKISTSQPPFKVRHATGMNVFGRVFMSAR